MVRLQTTSFWVTCMHTYIHTHTHTHTQTNMTKHITLTPLLCICTQDNDPGVHMLNIFTTPSHTTYYCAPTHLVGVSTSAHKRDGVSKSDCRIGIANAPVLPDPVSARPMMSRPEMTQ